ncbi:MAG: ligD [Crocinitomicaceae bacterium]|jgi:bifunctional non-homologous end joining protein LigD|nr:ligD [Crocinitomicaceae bacterium]
MSLDLYKKKRNFSNTPEPGAEKGKKGPKLTFVVQRHFASHLHYDFRLEMEGVLKSWAVPKGPSMVSGERHLAVMVEDHPLPYGKFYGEIPEGNYGAGTVEIFDSGTYEPLEPAADAEKSLLKQLEKGDLKIVLDGTYLKGAFALVRMNDGKNKNWLLIKKKDEFALKSFTIADIPALKSPGKKKARTEPEAKAAVNFQKKQKIKTLPVGKSLFREDFQPMLARLSKEMFDRSDWFYEMKYDGYRALAEINKGKVELISRNGNSFTKLYKDLVKELEIISEDVVLDGEVVIENKQGRSDFQQLQNFGTTGEGKLKFYVFDILYLNGHSLEDFPLRERKDLLDTWFKSYKFRQVFNAPYQLGGGKKLFADLAKKSYEGIIAKDPESLYRGGRRSDSWLKIKTEQSGEAIIAGYTLPQNSRKYFGSLILGEYEGDTLKYIGNCGTGFSDASLKELYTAFEKLKTNDCPFPEKPQMYGTKGKPVWILPELVCNVKFAERTESDRLRAPVFMGLRLDKEATEVEEEQTLEQQQAKSFMEKDQILKISGKNVKCTNLTKVYWPEEKYTKGDLIAYYQSVGKYILPYLKNRPQSLNRFPNGISGSSFYQKDMDTEHLPEWVQTSKIYSKSNDTELDYLICNDLATLVYMANLGCIEINPWHSTWQKPDHPTYLMLDLDPGEISFVDVVNTALVIKELCDEIKAPCYCKTSGATGLHVYIPLGAKYTYDEVKAFGELLALLTHNRLPDTTSIERRVAGRKDKIYVDFLQNRKGQTIAAPYSVRPRAMATVSTPLLWEEVNHSLSPQQFTIQNTVKRLEKVGDLWKPVLGKGINLQAVLKLLEKL